MDKIKAEAMIYGHCCPQCYPERIGMVRKVENVNILNCEICGFEIDDSFLIAPYVSLEEIARNYLALIKQVLLNTKSDFHKYTKLKEIDSQLKRKRAKRELAEISSWVERSSLIGLLAHLANLDESNFRSRIGKELQTCDRYRWKLLFQKFTDGEFE
jgi:hypothetical protein